MRQYRVIIIVAILIGVAFYFSHTRINIANKYLTLNIGR